MSILDFKSALSGGGARANQFRVYLNFPSFVPGGQIAGNKGVFLCNAASLPGSNIGVAPTYYRGREVKLAGERTFDPWTIQVTNDTDFGIRDAFEEWMWFINQVDSNKGYTDPLSYTADMMIDHLDRNDNVIKTYQFRDAWPVNLGDIQLSFSANDQIEEFPVTLVYQYWDLV